MIIYVNSKQIELKNITNKRDIVENIASKFNTLPIYLRFDDTEFVNNGEYKVDDLLSIITEHINLKKNSFDELYNKVATVFKNIDINDIMAIYIYKMLENAGDIENKEDYLFHLAQTKYIVDDTDLDSVNNKFKYINRLIDQNKSNVQNREVNNMDEVIGVQYTSFELENATVEYQLNIENISLLELFNRVQTNDAIILARCKDFFKVSVKPNINLLEKEDEEDSLILYFDASNKKYKDIYIKLEITKDFKLKYEFDFVNTYQDLIKKELSNVLNMADELTFTEEKMIKVRGVFYIPNQKINKFILSDIILNDEHFPTFYIDESEKIAEKLYVRFEDFNSVSNATITEQIIDYTDKKNINLKDQTLYSNFIRIKLNSDSYDSVEVFQINFSKLVSYYNENQQAIVDFYETLIPTLTSAQENVYDIIKQNLIIKNQKKMTDLKLMEPEMFLPGYVRHVCTKKCDPSVIEDDDNNNGNLVMRFPKNIPGFLQRRYICNTKDNFIYPGLQLNKMDNSEIFPYLPCCYQEDQRLLNDTKKNTAIKQALKKYASFEDEDKEEDIENEIEEEVDEQVTENVTQQKIYRGNRFLYNNNFGILPPNLTKLFGDNYYRKGVSEDKDLNSFIKCLQFAFDQNDVDTNDFRTQLSRYAILSKQENYDTTVDKIIETIENPEVLFNPSNFVRILEEHFECNIFLLSRDNEGVEFLNAPNHLNSFYKYKNNNRCVFLYYHMGSPKDKAVFPHCELIYLYSNNDETYVFDYDSDISQKILNVFNNIVNPVYVDDIFSNFIIESQVIDSFGKTRIINIRLEENNNELFSIFTSPLPPLNVKEYSMDSIYKVKDKDTIDAIIEILNLTNIKQNVINGKTYEIHGKASGIQIIIPVDKIGVIEDFPVFEGELIIPENSSFIVKYNKYKKVSKCIAECALWLFSKFLSETNSSGPFEDIIKNFTNNYIKINRKINYDNIVVQKTFNDNTDLIVNNKLVIRTEKTLKRIMYLLKLNYNRNYDRLLEYHNNTYIDNYYTDISDFDKYPSQIMFKGKDTLKKWVNTESNEYFVHNSIQLELASYFFKNSLVDDNVYVAYNTDSLLKAINIATGKEDNKYYKYTLYSYINQSNITPYEINGVKNNVDIKILGYKVNDKSFFTALKLENQIKELNVFKSPNELSNNLFSSSGDDEEEEIQNGNEFVRLPNFGNTCYINSCIQFLNRIEGFGSFEEFDKIKDEAESELISNLVSIINDDENRHDNLQNFALELVPKFYDFESGSQQDAGEFLTKIIDIMSPVFVDRNGSKPALFDSLKLLINTEVTYRCDNKQVIPKEQNNADENMSVISLPIIEDEENLSIKSLLLEYQMFEPLEKPLDSITCSDGTHPTEKRTKIVETNDNLIIQLKRFDNDLKKNSSNVLPDSSLTIRDELFKLDSCIIHIGRNMRRGHYVVVIFDEFGKPSAVLNDNNYIEYEEVKNDKEYEYSSNGYIYLYKKYVEV